MSALGQSIHDEPNQIYSMCGPRMFCDEIHSDIFPFSHRNVQRLHLSVEPLLLELDLPAAQAPLYIASYILLHAGRPVIKAKILIHHCRPEMDGEPRLMGLLHQYLTYSSTIGNPNPPMQGQETTAIKIK